MISKSELEEIERQLDDTLSVPQHVGKRLELSTLRAQLAAVVEALEKLSAVLHKLDAPDSAMNGVFAFAAIHGYFYTGPQWGEALKQADAALTPDLAALAAGVELGREYTLLLERALLIKGWQIDQVPEGFKGPRFIVLSRDASTKLGGGDTLIDALRAAIANHAKGAK